MGEYNFYLYQFFTFFFVCRCVCTSPKYIRMESRLLVYSLVIHCFLLWLLCDVCSSKHRNICLYSIITTQNFLIFRREIYIKAHTHLLNSSLCRHPFSDTNSIQTFPLSRSLTRCSNNNNKNDDDYLSV